MSELYWSPAASSWTYRHRATQRVLGRVDCFEDVREIGYWWQTSNRNGICSVLSSAKRCVEHAVWKDRAGKAVVREAREGEARAASRRGVEEDGAMQVAGFASAVADAAPDDGAGGGAGDGPDHGAGHAPGHCPDTDGTQGPS